VGVLGKDTLALSSALAKIKKRSDPEGDATPVMGRRKKKRTKEKKMCKKFLYEIFCKNFLHEIFVRIFVSNFLYEFFV